MPHAFLQALVRYAFAITLLYQIISILSFKPATTILTCFTLQHNIATAFTTFWNTFLVSISRFTAS